MVIYFLFFHLQLIYFVVLLVICVTFTGFECSIFTYLPSQLFAQVMVGCLFVAMGYIDLNEERRQRKLNFINNTATIAVFIITIINILIAGFGLNAGPPR